MEIRPILSAMLRSKTGPLLIAMQIAITLAIVVNAAFITDQRSEKMGRDTGMDDQNLIFVGTYGFGASYDHRESIRQDLDALRAMPGVVNAAYMDGVPLSGSGANSGYSDKPIAPSQQAVTNANYYNVDERAPETLGLKLESGRWFRADEIEYRPGETFMPESIVITRATADGLFGEGELAVGKLVYDAGNDTSRVIGVVEHMQGAWVNWNNLDHVLLRGAIAEGPLGGYVVRVEPGLAGQMVAEIETKLQEISRNRVVIEVRTLADHMAESYSRDSAMIQLLSGVSLLLVAVTALGIIGLAAFNVNQRRKQIGTRRALGATRRDVLRYFMTESLLIAGIGVLLGIILAFLMSWWLGTQFSLPALDWRFIPPAIFGLLIISQLAVLGPAQRATLISPSLATRSV
ncbi:FtsX-like permease family protein [Proteobacteria bacterium 005FR1]|nr:FtsX-like permease family protein [Proteobacteria bacterium 005FR1]